ncbi:hypothetical protein [Glutamicibacter protophormiae]|uniref:Pycsar effector protein domain-containing protein n=1 Tax=Glutamicibacter protophormiae TaxID=37930 RepID=A0ABS4XTG7_GLUPR|nr:hypothetical protein [Glutamicibacter protophormiae]MBP2399806.1 hypothetical protein [Glutamicibacter protophormiae]
MELDLPMRRRRGPNKISEGSVSESTSVDASMDGCFQALDQLANWVRFADTKATILTAGLGVVLTVLVANANTVVSAIKYDVSSAIIVSPLLFLACAALLWTLYWLIRAIGPQTSTAYSEINRFAWPALQEVTVAQLELHIRQVDVASDGWRQVLDLSKLAKRKFEACSRAVAGFSVLALSTLACVLTSVIITS